MAVYELRTFDDILNAVREELKIQAGDTTSMNRLRRDINMVYINEVSPADNWYWLRKTFNLQTIPSFFLGTASVLTNSQTVTLTETPTYSREGFLFSTDDFAEVYRVKRHTPNTTTLVLDRPYMGKTNLAARFSIWSDAIPLPTEIRETTEVGLELAGENMHALGYQEFRRTQKLNPKEASYPVYYTTTSFKDPEVFSSISGMLASAQRKSDGLVKTVRFTNNISSFLSAGDRIRIKGAGQETYNGTFTISARITTNNTNDTIVFTGDTNYKENFTTDSNFVIELQNKETADERYRELLIHPSRLPTKTTLKVDGILRVKALEDADEEPLIPIEDRIVLVYGALWKAWSRERNPEEAGRNFQLFQNKLALMKSKMEDSVDFPRLVINYDYLRMKRRQY